MHKAYVGSLQRGQSLPMRGWLEATMLTWNQEYAKKEAFGEWMSKTAPIPAATSAEMPGVFAVCQQEAQKCTHEAVDACVPIPRDPWQPAARKYLTGSTKFRGFTHGLSESLNQIRLSIFTRQAVEDGNISHSVDFQVEMGTKRIGVGKGAIFGLVVAPNLPRLLFICAHVPVKGQSSAIKEYYAAGLKFAAEKAHKFPL